MKAQSIDNERACPRATNHQQNVAGSLQACCLVPVEYFLFRLQGYGALINHNARIVSVPKGKFCRDAAQLCQELRLQHGWHTQIGII